MSDHRIGELKRRCYHLYYGTGSVLHELSSKEIQIITWPKRKVVLYVTGDGGVPHGPLFGFLDNRLMLKQLAKSILAALDGR